MPRQLNGYDCGLFVCQYAAALHQNIDFIFTHDDIYSSSSPLLEKITHNEHFQFDQGVITDFREQLGSLIDNLSSVYHFGKLPKSSWRKSGGKATKACKATKEKVFPKRTRSRNHKLLDGVLDNNKKSSPFRRHRKLKGNVAHNAPDQNIQVLTEDLKTDSESVLDLLADPFLPSPEKKNAYVELKDSKHQGHLLKHDNLQSYANESPLPPDQVEEVDELASKIITLVQHSEVPNQQLCDANESTLPANHLEEVEEPGSKITTVLKQLEVLNQQPRTGNESPVPADQLEEVEEPGSEISTALKQSKVLNQQPCTGNESPVPDDQLEEVEELASKLEHELYKPPTDMFPELVFVTDGEYNQPSYKELEQAADGLGKPEPGEQAQEDIDPVSGEYNQPTMKEFEEVGCYEASHGAHNKETFVECEEPAYVENHTPTVKGLHEENVQPPHSDKCQQLKQVVLAEQPNNVDQTATTALKRPNARTTTSSFNNTKTGVVKRRDSRKVLSGKADFDSPTKDHFVGKTVAFGCTTSLGTSAS